ncbi:CRISPR-associated protein Csh2 [Porphyromonas gulae]|uniref:type I-C CRISPR-associated protein Cas7/Csd2 n=1 Tax=Porphyromonas gulae TaxID=111105 RepID=UPI00052C62A0|nr:type I-C CRISPR-associated protein Cas7/Csd2 [Porphyromonas gulae]KGN67231.1 CRISPR-associated protein Csh2 [Porphyromonas gulae]
MEKTAITNRYDFVYLFDVQDGNPNGDPDAGNMPRIDTETGHGLVTDVCLKRKVRNYVEVATSSGKIDNETNKIFIREGAILNNTIASEYEATGENTKEAARARMCRNYYDVRTFGAVMSTGDKEKNAGQVRGAVQLTFARSISPIIASEHTITRMAVATEKEAEKQKGDNRTMGRKSTVPYALYRAHGFISCHLANDTGFGEEDLKLFWQALEKMFDHDRSAARGLMAARKLIIFKHNSALGNAPAHQLLERVHVNQRDTSCPPRCFDDYEIVINRAGLPDGIEIIEQF